MGGRGTQGKCSTPQFVSSNKNCIIFVYFLKLLCYIFIYLFDCARSWLSHARSSSLILNPDLLHWECRVLATRPQGKTHTVFKFKSSTILIGSILTFMCSKYDAFSVLLWNGLWSVQLCLILCNPMNCSPSGSSVHGTSQERVLEWVAMSFSRGSSQPRDPTSVSCVSCIAGGFFTCCAIEIGY